MEESRTKNTIKNVTTGMIVQLVNRLMTFVVRTVFIRVLNSEYLGVNGLFTNILTILSFTELGIGTAIIFSMYKPIAENDKEKIKGLMKIYKICYNIIGITVFILGLCIIPFMNFIVTDIPNIKENIIFIYILFLLNTSSSYFFTYKKSIITAYQKQSIINNINSVFYFIRSILEIIFLIFTKNYIVYLSVQILLTFVENIILARKANNMFPFIKEKNVTNVSKEEKKSIFSNVKSLVVYKFGEVVLNGTDNIIMAAMVNVATVGLCSNYTLIIQSVETIVSSLLNGATASIGNLNISNDKKRKEQVFYQFTLINFLIYSFCAIAFIVLLNPFIKLWIGNDYVLELSISIALSISFFIKGIRLPCFTYRTTLGLFSKGKVTPYIGAIINIVSSIILCKIFGTVGIFIGTSIAQLLSYSWIDPYLIYKYEFKTSVWKYFKKYVLYFGIFLFDLIIALCVTTFIEDLSIFTFILKAVIVLIIPNLLNILIFHKTEEFKELISRFIYPFMKKYFNILQK